MVRFNWHFICMCLKQCSLDHNSLTLEGFMTHMKWNYLMTVLFLALALFTFAESGAALDEVVLNGIVRNINIKERIIDVEVKSSGCGRVKSFSYREQDVPHVSSLQIGQELRFATHRFKCEDRATGQFITEIPGGRK